MSRALLIPCALVVLLCTVPSAAQADVRGAVGGIRDPAAGVIELSVQAAEDSGAGLRSATATLGGVALATAAFPDPGAGEVRLRLDTTAVPDGVHRLEVTVADGSGALTALADRSITVINTPPAWTSSVTLTLGSGAAVPGGGPTAPSGGTPPPRAGCARPRLSIALTRRPLRFRRGIAVLERGRRYGLAGRLTCRVDGRRRPAARGTRVEVRHVVRGRTVAKPALRALRDGRLAGWIRPATSRVLVFRVRAAGGMVVRVRIPVHVVERRR